MAEKRSWGRKKEISLPAEGSALGLRRTIAGKLSCDLGDEKKKTEREKPRLGSEEKRRGPGLRSVAQKKADAWVEGKPT